MGFIATCQSSSQDNLLFLTAMDYPFERTGSSKATSIPTISPLRPRRFSNCLAILPSVNLFLMFPSALCLSGGLDSSALTALAAAHYKESGQGRSHTFSVDYKDNDKHFKANLFQPNSDAPWIKRMTDHLGTEHHYIEFDTPELVESLKTAVFARDTPGMADVDGSLYLFCREIKKEATVAISGEAADEIFGGYPWFHNEEALEANTFPWSLKLSKSGRPARARLRRLD